MVLQCLGKNFVWDFTSALNHQSDFSELLLHMPWEEDFCIELLSGESVDGTSVISPALFTNTNFRVLVDVA